MKHIFKKFPTSVQIFTVHLNRGCDTRCTSGNISEGHVTATDMRSGATRPTRPRPQRSGAEQYTSLARNSPDHARCTLCAVVVAATKTPMTAKRTESASSAPCGREAGRELSCSVHSAVGEKQRHLSARGGSYGEQG